MIDGLKPYSEYKECNSPWLRKLPKHWKLQRAKTVLRERSEKGFPGEPLLAATQSSGVVRKEQYENRTVLALKDLHLLKLVRVRDFVISLRSFQGGIEYAREQGIISPAYTVLYPVEVSFHGFLAWLFKSKPYIENLSLYVTGIRQGQNIDYERLSRSELILPPPDEQDAIVRFLDHANRRIERYIRAKKKLIALLKEQKQAIIHRAVTRGLGPNVRLKPSGIPCLGDIPEHYSRTRLGRVCLSIRDGTHNPPPAVPGNHRLLSVRNIIDGRFVTRADDRTMTPQAFAELQRSYTVNKGDVVIALVGATTGKSAVVEQMENVTVQRSLGILRPNSDVVDSHFLNLLIASETIQSQIRMIMDKYAAQPGIYLTELGRLQVVYPSVDTQRQIVAWVWEQTKELDVSVDTIRHEMNLIHEYRTRLIADVVTGQLDVREAATKLPVEPEAETESIAESTIDEDESSEFEDMASSGTIG
jgi:type I restriction enzyme S subunit